jgi:hypothetical protein
VTAFSWEREEWRNARDLDEFKYPDDRPTASDLWGWDETEFDEGQDDE